MKKILLALSFLPIAVIVLFYTLSLVSRSQSAAGIVDGKLTRCPDSPNCVCSEFPEDTAYDHAIDPIQIPEGKEAESMVAAQEVIETLGGKIVVSEGNYLAATFTSKVFRFIDDVEVRLETESGLLHVRSASRSGYDDIDANVNRMVAFREAFASKIAE